MGLASGVISSLGQLRDKICRVCSGFRSALGTPLQLSRKSVFPFSAIPSRDGGEQGYLSESTPFPPIVIEYLKFLRSARYHSSASTSKVFIRV